MLVPKTLVGAEVLLELESADTVNVKQQDDALWCEPKTSPKIVLLVDSMAIGVVVTIPGKRRFAFWKRV